MLETILKELTPEQKELLNYAFENELSQYVIINRDIFVGVNVQNCSNLEIIESNGPWSYGKIQGVS